MSVLCTHQRCFIFKDLVCKSRILIVSFWLFLQSIHSIPLSSCLLIFQHPALLYLFLSFLPVSFYSLCMISFNNLLQFRGTQMAVIHDILNNNALILFSDSFILLFCEVAQSCPTLCDPMDRSLPGFSVRGILQARILEWVTISFSRGSSRPRDQTRISCSGGRRFNL